MKLNSPNDVVIGPDGAIYFTDPTLDLVKGEKQEIPFQGVYRLDDKGELRLLTKDLTQPNGLAFSPDGKHFYVDDDDDAQRNIRVYDVASDGSLSNGRIFGAEPGGPHEGVPDGIKVDHDGKPVCDRAKRYLGVGSARPPSGHNRNARTASQSHMGRQGLPHALHHGDDVSVSSPNKSPRLRALSHTLTCTIMEQMVPHPSRLPRRVGESRP